MHVFCKFHIYSKKRCNVNLLFLYSSFTSLPVPDIVYRYNVEHIIVSKIEILLFTVLDNSISKNVITKEKDIYNLILSTWFLI